MAVTFALLNATLHELKYLVTSAGVEAGNLDAAGAGTPDMLTDARTVQDSRKVGTIGQLLTTAIGSQAAGRVFAFQRNDIEITLHRNAVAWEIEANTDGAGHLRLTLSAGGADAVGTILSIKMRHSEIR